MSNPNDVGGGVTANDAAISDNELAQLPDAHADDAPFLDDAAASQVLADILTGGTDLTDGIGAGVQMEDLHAVLASVPDGTFISLDDAAHHLTTSVDLFDVPVFQSHDAPDHGG